MLRSEAAGSRPAPLPFPARHTRAGEDSDRRRPLRRLSPDEVEVPEVDDEAGSLAEAERDRADRHRVHERDRPADDAEVPERDRHDRLLAPFGGEPLDEEARREQRLAEQAHRGPQIEPEMPQKEPIAGGHAEPPPAESCPRIR